MKDFIYILRMFLICGGITSSHGADRLSFDKDDYTSPQTSFEKVEVFDISGNIRMDFDRDFYLYKLRGGVDDAMPYVADLNERIEKQVNNRNERVYAGLTGILSYVITTGASFGIRESEPTEEELNILTPSFTYIEALAQKVDHIEHELLNHGHKSHDHKNYLNHEDTIEHSRERVINRALNSRYFNKNSDTPTLIRNQINGLKDFLKDNSVQKNAQKVAAFEHDLHYEKPDAWYDVKNEGTRNERVVVRDINYGHEFYMMDTPADGSCWAHSLSHTIKDSPKGKDFQKKLLSLTEEERANVCDFEKDFFWATLREEYRVLLRDHPGLVLECEALLKRNNLSRQERVNFLSKKEVFKALVMRPGKDYSDEKSIIAHDGSNVWTCSTREWFKIWVKVHNYNFFDFSYIKKFETYASILSPYPPVLFKKGNPWSFLYKGYKDDHFSALYPVKGNRPTYLKTYANKNYFEKWHACKTMEGVHSIPKKTDNQRKKLGYLLS